MNHPEFDNHDTVLIATDRGSRLRAIIAVHDTTLGPALGGCRMYPYSSVDEALDDVLRLSRGMTYKNAIAGVPMGGGKAVIIGNPRRDRSDALLVAFATRVNELGGRYVTGEDLGVSLRDVKLMARHTPYVTGVGDGENQGDPGPRTALGVCNGMRAAVKFALGNDRLQGLTVAIQGLGSVGWALAQRLHTEGVKLIVADAVAACGKRAADQFGARVVKPEEILGVAADVLSPCALGGVLDGASIARLQVPVVCGCANNQLANRSAGEQLRERGIAYAPDYVVNAGAVIAAASEYLRRTMRSSVSERIERIYETTLAILERARAEGRATSEVADSMARGILADARTGRR